MQQQVILRLNSFSQNGAKKNEYIHTEEQPRGLKKVNPKQLENAINPREDANQHSRQGSDNRRRTLSKFNEHSNRTVDARI